MLTTNPVVWVSSAFLIGSTSWFATHLIAKPVVEVLELRKRVWEELLVTANFGATDEARYQETVQRLRRLAAQASALDVAWPSWSRWVLQDLLRQDLAGAAKHLLGLSNTLWAVDGGAWEHRSGVQIALRLPQSITPSSRTAGPAPLTAQL